MCGPIDAGTASIGLSAEVQALLEVGMCCTLTGGDTPETVCIVGLSMARLVHPTYFAHPAGSLLTILEGICVSSNTSTVITCGPLDVGSTSINLSF